MLSVVFCDYLLPVFVLTWTAFSIIAFRDLRDGDFSSLLSLLIIVLIPGILYIVLLSSFWREVKYALNVIRIAFPDHVDRP